MALKQNHLERRNHTYYFRYWIPKSLQPFFKKTHVRYTFSVGYNRTATQSYTLEQIVENVFHEWKSRGTCISYKNMRAELGIDDIIKQRKKNKDEIIFCLEYYENINNFFINRVAPQLSNYKYKLKNEWEIFIQNIKILLDHLNYKRIEFEEEERVLLVPRNPAAKAVAEISSDDVAFAILKYHHASLKGQLEEKRKLLLSIANEYEPLLKRPIDGFKDYFDKATNMLNNMNKPPSCQFVSGCLLLLLR